jgi:hypothetical protein
MTAPQVSDEAVQRSQTIWCGFTRAMLVAGVVTTSLLALMALFLL